MNRYSKNSKPFIYVAFPQSIKSDVLNVLETLNKDNIEFWYPDSFGKKEITRIEASFSVLAFVTDEYSKTDEFHNIIDTAIKFNKNILCVCLQDIEQTSWYKMQLGSQQSLRTDSLDNDFIDKLKGSFIFKDMKVTSIQKKLQRNRAIVFVSIPIIIAAVVFLTVVQPLMAEKRQTVAEYEQLTEKWGIKQDDLEQITELYIIGERHFNTQIHAEYSNNSKTEVEYWLDKEHNDSLKYGGTWSTGTLTSEDLQIVKYMPNLRKLSILGEQITDISPLFGSRITQLNLSCNPISSIEGIEQIPELRSLKLTDTDITDIEPLRGLKYLEYLQIDKTNVTNIDAVEDLTNLYWLNISDTKVTKITTLPKVNDSIGFSLSAYGCKLDDVSGLANISNYREVGIDNYSRRSEFDRKVGDALENSEVVRFYYSGCVSFEGLSKIKLSKYNDMSVRGMTNVGTLNGIEKIENLQCLRIFDYYNEDNVIDLSALLKSETLTVVVLPHSLENIANAQLNSAKFSIRYE